MAVFFDVSLLRSRNVTYSNKGNKNGILTTRYLSPHSAPRGVGRDSANPMTVSAIAATILRDWINQNQILALKPARFQKRLAKSNSLAWMLATGQDLRFATTQGGDKSVSSGGFFHSYKERLLKLTNSDPKMNALLMEVAHLLKSPLALDHPQVVLQVLTKGV